MPLCTLVMEAAPPGGWAAQALSPSPYLPPVTLAALVAPVLLVRVGQVMYTAGLSRAKNSAGAVLRGLCDLCVSVLAFWAVGAAILFQSHNGIFGVDRHFLFGASLASHGSAATAAAAGGASGAAGAGAATLVLLFALVSSIASGAVAGSAGERSRFFPLLLAPVLLAGLLVPLGGSWTTHGWLARFGFLDVAGASWVHLPAGVCAAVAAWAVGPRDGKYHRDGSASLIPGHSVPLAGVGVLVMTVGWLCYVAACAVNAWGGAAAGGAALNAMLSAAAAGLAAVLVGRVRYGKPDVGLTLMGVLGGLVAVSAAGGAVASVWAVVIGAVAGVLVPLASVWIDLVLRIDDPVGAVAVHAVAGLWGTLAAGLFAQGTPAQRARQLGVQALGAAAIAAVAAVASLALFLALKSTLGLRAKEADEYDGLDLAEHDIAAYPDFQQNTIRSYHLREA